MSQSQEPGGLPLALMPRRKRNGPLSPQNREPHSPVCEASFAPLHQNLLEALVRRNRNRIIVWLSSFTLTLIFLFFPSNAKAQGYTAGGDSIVSALGTLAGMAEIAIPDLRGRFGADVEDRLVLSWPRAEDRNGGGAFGGQAEVGGYFAEETGWYVGGGPVIRPFTEIGDWGFGPIVGLEFAYRYVNTESTEWHEFTGGIAVTWSLRPMLQ